jgi:hypothetical protein
MAPHPGVLQVVAELARGKARVVEIGPGSNPFPLATEFVDWLEYPGTDGRPVHAVDLNRDVLPFPDKSIDFLYCRHVLEDLYNPLWLCREIARVAKAGYVETPSPFAEYCRGMNGGLIPEGSFWRGYIHHRYFVWNEDGTLCFLPKFPLVEYIDLDCDQEVADLLVEEPLHWNSYLLWDESLPTRHLQHDIDFRLYVDYDEMIRRALDGALSANLAFRHRHGLDRWKEA